MKFFFPILLFTFLSCSPEAEKVSVNPDLERWQAQAKNVEIIRDDFGVPHIYGKTDADAVFGMLYAQCEDDFNRVEHNYIWATGRLAEIEGENAIYSDLRANLFMTEKEAIAHYESSPEWLKKLCLAFADGINYYLSSHPEVEPKLIKHFEPWMPFYFSEGSIGGDIERVSTKKIQQFYDQKQLASNTIAHDGKLGLQYGDHQGSNGFAISGKLTRSGNSMLLINPHTSFFFRGEIHVVSEEGLNAYGAVTWGQFFIYQGFNENTGWMHTSTGTDIIDEFEETIIENETNLQYLYGNEKRDLISFPVKLKYLTDEGLKEKSFTLYRSHHGPITHGNEKKWVATALMWKPVKALEQSFIRTKQKDHEGFRRMMDLRTNSSNNTVFADSEGNIAYYHGNFIPRRNPKFDYSKPVDGSDPSTDWKGLHTVDENILIVNPEIGWIQNCNSTPFSATGSKSPKTENYPAYMASFPENYRGVHAIALLSEARNLTLESLIDLAYDPFLPGAKELIDGLIKASKNNENFNDSENTALGLLENWNFEVHSESSAMTLAQYYLNTYRKSGFSPYSSRDFMKMVHYMSKESSEEERVLIFKKSIEILINDFGTSEVPWGEYNRYQRINGDIVQKFNDSLPSIPVGMASGYWGALASFGTRHGENTKRVYGVGGNSFVAVVEFGDKVMAKTLLAGGQSGDPDSEHFDDQAERYARVQFKNAAFYRDDVVKRAEKRYRPGE
ncbi:penicillin acylase family protein [Lutimonas zeaxanthinifaciens]|uniref:penicillin acylase family protein n=1 Tax=Lutimonas zeaxanthinifaciens TaxID=3060215 RepID=UPI00265D08E5|nr:penicillin acylase family protein [Lutimonas sp. YSD2104]WKK66199.1 penicillin acylase family protein [Lutimonas sp. YSD2104]